MDKPGIVLLVEDDPTHVNVIKKGLHDFDRSIVIEHVSSGDECINLLQKDQQYNLIILNFHCQIY